MSEDLGWLKDDVRSAGFIAGVEAIERLEKERHFYKRWANTFSDAVIAAALSVVKEMGNG
jgi:hypothetical protein